MLNIQSHKISAKGQPNVANRLTCLYRNATETLQIIRISNHNCAFFERTVMTNECVQFLTACDAMLEVYEANMFNFVQVDTIPCVQLAIASGIDNTQKPTYTPELASLRDLQDLQDLQGLRNVQNFLVSV